MEPSEEGARVKGVYHMDVQLYYTLIFSLIQNNLTAIQNLVWMVEIVMVQVFRLQACVLLMCTRV